MLCRAIFKRNYELQWQATFTATAASDADLCTAEASILLLKLVVLRENFIKFKLIALQRTMKYDPKQKECHESFIRSDHVVKNSPYVPFLIL